ncbi:MAG: hypothetical protein SGARI_003607 [Bacillariaceae sp.]
MSTPAPSLEELPPEQGTILELHSIGEKDFDGVLVEFNKIDKATGKFFVTFLEKEQEDQGLRVKPKCCKRPDIKPFALRKTLYGLAEKFHQDMKSGANPDEIEMRLNGLLQKDPCCVPAYGINADPEYVKRVRPTRCVQREVANFHAYREFFSDGQEQRSRTFLGAMLANDGRFNTSVRQQRQLENSVSTNKFDAMAREMSSAKCLMNDAVNQLEKGDKAKSRRKLTEAADILVRFFGLPVTDDAEVPIEVQGWLDSVIKKTKLFILAIINGLGDAAPTDQQERYEVAKQVMKIYRGTLEACTSSEETGVSMNEDELSRLEAAKLEALEKLGVDSLDSLRAID